MSTPTPVPPSITPVTAPSAPTLVPLPPTGNPPVVVHAVERPSNMAVVVHLRPNGDPAGDSKATFYIQATTTPADIQAWVAQEKARVLAEYLAAHNAISNLIAAIGT